MLNASSLADELRVAIGFPPPTSPILEGWASAFLNELQSNAIVTNSLVTGSCPPGGSLGGGASVGGLISGLSGSRLASATASASAYPSVTSKLSGYSSQIVLEIMSFGLVSFASGNITGSCTNSPVSPGSLAGGAGANGVISGLSGSRLASAIHNTSGYSGSVSPSLLKFSTAIVDHLQNNGVASYAAGSVTGTCPAGGGSLSGGMASGGKIS
jgi:hypothetical protein